MRDRGVVLINALVLVIAIASVAAALLARAQAARTRAAEVQAAQQIGFHLDAGEALAAILLAPAGKGGGVVHSGQDWATERDAYRIGAGSVAVRLADLQGRMNVNWLAGPEDAFADEAFRRLFAEIGLSPGLVDQIRDVTASGGPRALPRYLRRAVPEQPRGGPVRLLDELRILPGLSDEEYALLSRYAAALPVDAKLNLNTAAPPVLRAVLHPFPPEVREAFLASAREGPVEHLKELRDLTISVLGTEDIEHLPTDRMTVSSRWFAADLVAELGDRVAGRRVIFVRDQPGDATVRATLGWALRD